MKTTFIFILSALLLFSCNNSNPIDDIKWIEGNWQATVQGNEVMENWKKENDSTWTGESAFVKDGKTLFTEIMSIRLRDDQLVFISAVSDQNGGTEIEFTELSKTANKIVFENTTHDFPQKITYELQKDNKLLAYITGDLNGQPERIDFKFTKVK